MLSESNPYKESLLYNQINKVKRNRSKINEGVKTAKAAVEVNFNSKIHMPYENIFNFRTKNGLVTIFSIKIV